VTGTRREPTNLFARSTVAFMPVSIEYTEDHVVAALLARPLLRAGDNADGRRTPRIVGNHHFRGGEIKMRASGFKIRLFGFSFANNQRDRPRRAVSGSALKGRSWADSRDMLPGQLSAVELSNQGTAP